MGRPSARTGRLSRPLKRLALAVAAVSVCALLAVAVINAQMAWQARGKIAGTVSDLPHAQAAIVLGAAVNPDGSMSAMLNDRVTRGGQLYLAGKVDKVIVSGDHGAWAYDEPGTMRRALQHMGVPDRDIFTDHAGFNTWATMKRAREVFGVGSATIVSQGFHLARALYLAESAGLDARAIAADLQPYAGQGRIGELREVAARVKAFGQAKTGAPVLLGPKIPIEGDGRDSWGPAAP